MWSTAAVYTMCILCGILCGARQVFSQPKFIHRKAYTFEKDVQKVIDQIHSLSGENKNARSYSGSSTGGGLDLVAYYNTLNNLYSLVQPLLKDRFIEDLPRTLVCLLSGRQDCGLQAELTKSVSLELGKPLLSLVSSMRSSEACTPLNQDAESNGFLGAYLRVVESKTAPDSLQDALINALSTLPLSGDLMNAVSSLVDTSVTYVSKLMATLLQIPLDFIKIALQFGIRIPSLDEKGTCDQGDLKQLILWGMNHNVSWPFSNSIVDILLDIFLAPEQSLCTYPGSECQNPPSVSFQRSISEDSDNNQDIVFKCDRHNLARFNNTLCADILRGSTVETSASVVTFCQTLSSLSPNQIEQVWSNTCYVLQALVSPLLSRSFDCSDGHATPSPAVTPPSEALPPSGSAPQRIAREALNLRELACNYKDWLENDVDAVQVSVCSDNERDVFVSQVCNNSLVMRKLLSDQQNGWLYGYCGNSPADPSELVSQLCLYDQWLNQPSVPVSSGLLQFCMSLDSHRLIKLICEHTRFYSILFSNPDNHEFMPNCTNMSPNPPPHPFPDMDSLVTQSCQYTEWHDVMQINTSVLSQCIQQDNIGFTQNVCMNNTFLAILLQNQKNDWLKGHCNTSLSQPLPWPTQPFNIAGFCDYQTWGERQVDNSVVGYCWRHDSLAFHKNVCCKASVFEKLLQDHQNQWLASMCTDTEEMQEKDELTQVCKYPDWTHPIIVDMTELAVCAEIDAVNFTSKVCANSAVLQNLLANQDNTWLLQHCANYSNNGISPGGDGGQEGGLTGFNPGEHCQYSSWTISVPDATLLTFCWEQDQTNFLSSICSDAALLLLLSREPSSEWVGTMCKRYANYTSTASNNSTNTESNFCLARNLVKRFNWSCTADLTPACQPGASQNMALQMMVRCWIESQRSRVRDLLAPPVATVLERAVSTTMVILLTLEEAQNTTLHVTKNIRLSVLASVVNYLEKENNFDKKRVLLQCFGVGSLIFRNTLKKKISRSLVEEIFRCLY